MFKWRAISFILLIALLWAIFFMPGWFGVAIYIFCACGMITLATYECAKMLNDSGTGSFPKLSGLLALLISAAALCAPLQVEAANWALFPLAAAILFYAVLIVAGPWLIILCKRGGAVKKVFTTYGVGMLLPLQFLMVAGIYYNRFQHSEHNVMMGPILLFFVICATKAMDTGGFIFGMISNKLMKNGNHKICPSISPKKSWEGVAGGIVFSLAVGWIFFKCFGDHRLWWYLAFSGCLGAASILGDLTESAVKRSCGVKDSGSWIPGMGGAFDLLDSFIYTGIVCIPFVKFLD